MLVGLTRRKIIVESIAKIKKENNIDIEDISREKNLLNKLLTKSKSLHLDDNLVKEIWESIIKQSKVTQKNM